MTAKNSRNITESAVSPVVAVMLMLVVTIIIAAIVSAFAGGISSGQKKVPQAAITGAYSIQDGLSIHHAGGDPLAMSDIQFTIWDGNTFGPNVEEVTKQTLNMAYMMDSSNNMTMNSDGTYVATAFRAGDTIHISAANCSCDLLQPGIVPKDWSTKATSAISYNGDYPHQYGLCIMNMNNIGKQFVLTASDKHGNLIGRTDLTVTS
jgi:archaeal type IV pilus assembly protein PilA